MKKTLYTLGFLALAALSIASCQKQPVPENESKREGKLVTVTFVAEAPNTKSGVLNEGESSVSYKWTAEDIANMRLYTVEINDKDEEILTEVSDPEITKVSDTELTITATVAEGSMVRAYMSKEQTSGGAPRIMATQNPLNNNFDPNADILISETEPVTEGMTEEGLIFYRKVVVNKMTLHNLQEGEKVKKVIISSDKGLNGYWNGSNMVANTNGGKTLTLNFDNVVVSSDKTFLVYFVSMPNAGHTLSIEVQTDQFNYSKTIESPTLDFNLGEFTRFNVGLPVGSPVNAFDGGIYAIANLDQQNGTTRIAVAYTSGNNLTSVSVTPTDGELVCAPDVDLKDVMFTFTEADGDYAGLFTIQDRNANYLYAASADANQLKAKAELDVNCYWSVSQNANGSFSIIASESSNRNVMQNNGTVFSCYASASQTAITLYPDELIVNDPTPLIKVLSDNPMNVPSTESTQTISYQLYNQDGNNRVSFSPAEDWIELDEVSEDLITFLVEAQEPGAPARSQEITLSYAGAEDVVIVVNQAAGEGSTIDYTTLETSNVTLSTTGGTNASTAKVNNFDALKAGTGSGAGAVKITIPANTTNLHIHAAGWNGETTKVTVSGASVTPSTLALVSSTGVSGNSPFTATPASNYYFNLALTGITEATTLTFTATTGKRFVIWGVNYEIDLREEAGLAWSSSTASASITNNGPSFSTTPTLTNNHSVDVTYSSSDESIATIASNGTVTIKAAGTTQISAVFEGNATYKPATVSYTLTVFDDRTFAISIIQTNGGEISANPSGSQKAGTEINLSATPAQGMKFDSWSVYKTGDESTSITVNNDKFSMPAYPVTVTASFVEDSGEFTTASYDFSKIEGFSDWGTSYSQHVVAYDAATVTFASANKQTSTITDVPVTKGGDVYLVLNSSVATSMKRVKFVCRQWGTKAQTITLYYSTDGGTTYTSTEVTSSNFTIEKDNLPEGTNAVKITFSSTSNQVGIASAEIDY